MEKLTFITLAIPDNTEASVLSLTSSLRKFGGEISNTPVQVLVPETHWPLSKPVQEKLTEQKVSLVPFEIDPDIIRFPFAAKIIAAAYAEQIAQGQSELLGWLDRDTLILNPPEEFILPANKALGYRPVHHKLIGPAWDEPASPFWELIYRTCNVPTERLFPMFTHVGEKIKAYFNAGTFCVRTEHGLLTQWRDFFISLYRQPEFRAFYEQDSIYAIFIHQAIWTGILLHKLAPNEMLELSPRINYPLHLHNEMPEHLRVATVNQLITARFEDIFSSEKWRKLPIEEPLKSWLEAQPLTQPASKG